MNTVRKIVLAIGLPVALIAAATATAVHGAAPPTSPPPPDDDEFVLPAGWTTLIDDTNTITVAVPDAWADIDTAPDSNPDGTLAPRIGAATDLDIFIETFDAPGVLFRAIPYTGDNQAEMSRYGLTSGCRRKDVQPYDDGAFVGLRGVWTSCGSTGTPQWHQIVASPASQSFTFIVQIQVTGDDGLADLENVVRSFNFTPEGGAASGPAPPPTVGLTPSTTTAAGSEPTPNTVSSPTFPTFPILPTSPTSPTSLPTPSIGPPTTMSGPLPTASGSVPPDSRQLVDDLGVLTVAVPASWAGTDTSPRSNDDGSDRPWIAASTDLELFLPAEGVADTFSVPGMLLTALPPTADVSGPLGEFGYPDECTDHGTQPYSDGGFTGLAQVFTDCGDTNTRIINIAANPPDNSVTVFLLLQLTSVLDDAAYDTVLSSFSIIGQVPSADAGGSTTAATAGPSTAR